LIIIHINCHYAIGVILASIACSFFYLNTIEFWLIVIFSTVCDLDIFLKKFALDRNHRNLISHSIIPSLIIIIIGTFTLWIALIISGISYLLHIIIDTLDWGTNFFYFNHKNIGFRFLISKEDLRNLEKILTEYKNPTSFFDFKYYKNKIIQTIEILLFILMVISIINFAYNYLYIIIFYFLGLLFHILRHYHLLKIEKN